MQQLDQPLYKVISAQCVPPSQRDPKPRQVLTVRQVVAVPTAPTRASLDFFLASGSLKMLHSVKEDGLLDAEVAIVDVRETVSVAVLSTPTLSAW